MNFGRDWLYIEAKTKHTPPVVNPSVNWFDGIIK